MTAIGALIQSPDAQPKLASVAPAAAVCGQRFFQMTGDLAIAALIVGAVAFAMIAIIRSQLVSTDWIDRDGNPILQLSGKATGVLIGLILVGGIGSLVTIPGAICLHLRRRRAEDALRAEEACGNDPLNAEAHEKALADLRARVKQRSVLDVCLGPLALISATMAIFAILALAQGQPGYTDRFTRWSTWKGSTGFYTWTYTDTPRFNRSWLGPIEKLGISLMVIGGSVAVGSYLLRKSAAGAVRLVAEKNPPRIVGSTVLAAQVDRCIGSPVAGQKVDDASAEL